MKIDPMFRFLDETVPREGNILDLGCGYGMAAHWLTQCSPNHTVIGWDNDARKIRVAQATARNHPKLRFESHNLLDEPGYPPCDCVLLLDVLHYFPRELKAEVLRKAFQALRPGGRLVLRDAARVPTRGHRLVEQAEKWAVWTGANQTRHGLHFEDEATHLTLLRAAGFARVEVKAESGVGSNTLIIAWA
jgi:SAM-dependent methyltransferase